MEGFDLMKRLVYAVLSIVSIFIISCSNDTAVEPGMPEGVITGQVRFVDGSPGAFARVNLQNLSNNRIAVDTADQNGIFEFNNLSNGDYTLSFLSTSYDIHTFSIDLTVSNSDTLYQDLFIVYRMLDDEKARTINDSVVVIKYHRDGAGIGENFDVIANLKGYYGGDLFNNSTLSCEIYILPNDFNWTDTSFDLTGEYIRENYEYVMEVKDTLMFGNHEIVFEGENIAKILSNPPNGFAFLRKGEPDRILRIPCVDRQNNDFGLVINYK